MGRTGSHVTVIPLSARGCWQKGREKMEVSVTVAPFFLRIGR